MTLDTTEPDNAGQYVVIVVYMYVHIHDYRNCVMFVLHTPLALNVSDGWTQDARENTQYPFPSFEFYLSTVGNILKLAHRLVE